MSLKHTYRFKNNTNTKTSEEEHYCFRFFENRILCAQTEMIYNRQEGWSSPEVTGTTCRARVFS